MPVINISVTSALFIVKQCSDAYHHMVYIQADGNKFWN